MTTNDMTRLMEAAATQDDHGEGAAIAALLRAVAAEGNPVWTRGIWAAAVALADSILGAGDE